MIFVFCVVLDEYSIAGGKCNSVFGEDNRETVINDDNAYFETEGGNNTLDKVYLLSIDEAVNPDYGFPEKSHTNSKTRQAKDTAYAEEHGAGVINNNDYSGYGSWWLRSPGLDTSYAAGVRYYGGLIWYNGIVRDYVAVRPALHLDLSSDTWRYAGTVTSDGEAEEK